MNCAIPFEFDLAGDFSENIAFVKKKDKVGFIDKDGHLVIPCQFDYDTDPDTSKFKNNHSVVRTSNKSGLIDKNGNIVLPFEYDFMGLYVEGLLSVKINGKYGFIDLNGQTVIPCIYDYCGNFKNGLSVVRMNNKSGIIDRNGNQVLSICYDGLRRPENTESLMPIFMARIGKYFGVIDLTGRIVLPFEFTNIHYMEKDYICVDLEYENSLLYEVWVGLDGTIYSPKLDNIFYK